jgi:hypothetical protein
MAKQQHDPAYCLLCLADTPHEGLVTLPAPRASAPVGNGRDGSAAASPAGTAIRPAPRLTDGPDAIGGIHDFLDEIAKICDLMEIAEEEICTAQRRYGEDPPARDDAGEVIGETGPLWNSFPLLRETAPLSGKAEFVYRAHCRELLHRVANGHDTRPATDVEMAVILTEVSKRIPLHGAAAGLYMRLFIRCFPEQARTAFAEMRASLDDYEPIYGSEIDDQEAWLRRTTSQAWRRSVPDVAPAQHRPPLKPVEVTAA